MKKRVFLIVLDSCGIGELPDAAAYGDEGSHTLHSCFETGLLEIPNLIRLGLGHIEGMEFLPHEAAPAASFGRCAEASVGKDTTTGHWEIAGLVSTSPMPTYPNGFPEEILSAFSKATGRGILCNRPYSGTQVIHDYGQEHERTGDLIVYTSADSVFQIAAHESVVPIDTLYEYCRIARKILTGEHAVGRVIARPFEGEWPNYSRTNRRHDYSVEPHGETLLDILKEEGFDVLSVGKISDIFAGRGITQAFAAPGNDNGMAQTLACQKMDFHGLCFTNLVDFDSMYGHRNDAAGYAKALNAFDAWLGNFLPGMREEDLLIITADHGCDPATPSTDHSREYVPCLIYSPEERPESLGTLPSFTGISDCVKAALLS